MSYHESFRPRDTLAVASVLILTGILYVHGGKLAAMFGLSTIVVWLFVPPVFAFAVGQAGLAVSLTSAPAPAIAIGTLALLGLLVGDPDVPSSVRSWTGAIVGSGLVAAAIIGIIPHSMAIASLVSVGGFCVLGYVTHRYGLPTQRQERT